MISNSTILLMLTAIITPAHVVLCSLTERSYSDVARPRYYYDTIHPTCDWFPWWSPSTLPEHSFSQKEKAIEAIRSQKPTAFRRIIKSKHVKEYPDILNELANIIVSNWTDLHNGKSFLLRLMRCNSSIKIRERSLHDQLEGIFNASNTEEIQDRLKRYITFFTFSPVELSEKLLVEDLSCSARTAIASVVLPQFIPSKEQEEIYKKLLLACSYNLHAAAGPEAEIALPEISSQELLKLHDEALDAFKANQPRRFVQIITAHPKAIYPPFGDTHLDLLYSIIEIGEAQEMNKTPIDYSFYITQILAVNNILKSSSLIAPYRNIFADLCRSAQDTYYENRLISLTKLFYLYKSSGAILPDELKTDKIRTPQEWLQHKALDFLESKKCSRRNTPWMAHTTIDTHRLTQLREALQLD